MEPENRQAERPEGVPRGLPAATCREPAVLDLDSHVRGGRWARPGDGGWFGPLASASTGASADKPGKEASGSASGGASSPGSASQGSSEKSK